VYRRSLLRIWQKENSLNYNKLFQIKSTTLKMEKKQLKPDIK
jgi:hypothetical protein